jgi:Family of unknown function (DUF5690)
LGVADIAAPSLAQTGGRRLLIGISTAIITFLAYSSVYAYRKPFTVADFNGLRYWGISFQTWLIIAQVTGYMLSKFAGIKFIAELKVQGRFKASLNLVGSAWIALLFFAVTPAPYSMIFLFINGFALGFMWGIVFSYAEGRRATDFIGAVMAVSFIFAGGFTRSVAKWLLVEWNVSGTWMPFITGLLFAIPLLFFLWLLEKIPPPDETDIKERAIRLPMTKEDRRNFLKIFGAGIGVVTVTYLFLTIMRDVRDNYMSNIWTELGYGNNYSIFTKIESNTSLIILLIMGFLVMVRKNIKALNIAHFIIAIGLALAGVSSILFISGRLDGALWMQLISIGLYMGYIPFNCIFFERLIAAFRVSGNVGFLIYFADAFGYAGSVLVMISKEFMRHDLNWAQFYSYCVIVGCVLGMIGIILSFLYFNKKYAIDKI